MWVTDGSSPVKIKGTELSSKRNPKRYGIKNVMWVDQEEIKSGEHYWTIQFGLIGSTVVGLTNKGHFGPDAKFKGLVYNGNLTSHKDYLVYNFGPKINSNDLIGLLLTFTEEPGRLKLYLYVNDKLLGLAFNIKASIFPNPHPAISIHTYFSLSATIHKKADIPPAPRLPKSEGLEGHLETVNKSIKMKGKKVLFKKSSQLRFVREGQGSNGYRMSHMFTYGTSFHIDLAGSTWKCSDQKETYKQIGFIGHIIPDDVAEFCKGIIDLCTDPDVVTIGKKGTEMKIDKGKSTGKFIRVGNNDIPKPFTGHSFKKPSPLI